MTLPLTLAIVSSLIIQTEGERFAIPQVNIEEIVRVKVDEFDERLARVRDGDVLKLRGELLPLVHLARGVGISKTYTDPETGDAKEDRRERIASKDLDAHPEISKWDKERSQNEPLRILVVRLGNNKFGIIVDEVLGSEEIVVKPMPEYLRHMSWYSGSTILGDGKVSLILDIPGFSTKNSIKFSETERISKSLIKDDESDQLANKQEAIELLIFNNGTKEQFAIPIPLIQRVDEINRSTIEQIGGDEFIDYHGKSVRLIHIEDNLPIQRPEESDNDIITMIIPKNAQRPSAIIIKHVVDTKSINLVLEKHTISHDSILGSAIIDGKITLLLDVHALTYTHEDRENSKKYINAKNKKILLVEDTPFFRKIESEYLSSVGYEVKTACDGEKALEIMSKETFDAIVTDIEMPNMNGIDFVTELRGIEQFKTIPVIALTSVADPNTKRKSEEIGFNGWLQKMNKNELLDTLRNLI
jgi:two-component system chemotaxis sensor kinase CheA